MVKINWDGIRNEYETTAATLQQLADKYNIFPGTLRCRKSREKWQKSSDNGEAVKTTKRVAAKTRKNVAALQCQKDKGLEIKLEDVDEELTEKQRLFCWHYVHNRNATQAAINAGYTKKYPAEVGYQLLHNSTVRAEVERLKKLKAGSLMLTPEDIVERYMMIAFANMNDFVDYGVREVTLVDKDGRFAKERTNYLDFKDASMVDGGLISEISVGKQGMKIKLEDRQKALNWLANYFEMNPADKHRQKFDEERLKLERERLEIERRKLAILAEKKDDGGDVTIIDDIGDCNE